MQKPTVVFQRVQIKGLQERGYMLLADTDINLAICLEIKCNSTFRGSLLEALGAGRQTEASCRIVADSEQVWVCSDSRTDKLQLTYKEIAERPDIG